MAKKISRNLVSTLALLAALGLTTSTMAGDSNTTKSDDAQASQAVGTESETGTGAGQTTEAAPDAGSVDQAEQSTEEPGDQAAEAGTEQPVEGQIVLQDETTILVSSLLGASVRTPEGEDIGDINDLLAGKDGSVQGVVIGVGGFLGIGEKEVAIEYGRLELTEDDDGVHLVLDANREELENAPSFKTAEAQKAEAERQRMQEEQERIQQDMQKPLEDGVGSATDTGSSQ